MVRREALTLLELLPSEVVEEAHPLLEAHAEPSGFGRVARPNRLRDVANRGELEEDIGAESVTLVAAEGDGHLAPRPLLTIAMHQD